MNIILGRERAAELREKFVVLDLETFDHADGMQIPAFCVVSAEKIPLTELPMLSHWVEMHNTLVNEYKKGNKNYCSQAIEHLRGKFGGEVDSFYDHMIKELQI